jgi:hypothetical protein
MHLLIPGKPVRHTQTPATCPFDFWPYFPTFFVLKLLWLTVDLQTVSFYQQAAYPSSVF